MPYIQEMTSKDYKYQEKEDSTALKIALLMLEN